MARQSEHSSAGVWRLAARQHGVITRAQLLALGYTRDGIEHRVACGRLHRKARGVYAVGRPDLTWHGSVMVALLACGPRAVASHRTAAVVWGILDRRRVEAPIHASGRLTRAHPPVPVHTHRGPICPVDRSVSDGIPVTSPPRTLLDLATQLSEPALERAVNRADSLDLVDPESLRSHCDRYAGRPGIVRLRAVLDRPTYQVTESRLEQRMLGLIARAGLPRPKTQHRHGRTRVDFFWLATGLVVEADSLRYHRTAATQQRDLERDQAHHAAGRTPLRFTHHQITYEQDEVVRVLSRVHARLHRNA